MATAAHRELADLEAELPGMRKSPGNGGPVRLLARRPAPGERELVEEARLDPVLGLVGDNWQARGSSRTDDGSAHPEMQLTLMNSRVIAAIAGEAERWALAGDQVFVDLELAESALPAGTRLKLGTATIEITPTPHTGCRKFVDRFGIDAMKFINSELGRKLRLRGVNARVVDGGTVRVGDLVMRAPRRSEAD